MGKISFNSEDVGFKMPQKSIYKAWIEAVSHSHGKKVGEISYIFCSDEYLLEMNKQYLQHDYYTDIITFDYSEGDTISGDLFISVDRVKDNANDLSISPEIEMQRVVIHGVLHLCGYGDKDFEAEQNMRKLEEKALEIFPKK
jgi:rRNA maturation RNase YbeY